jgi:hypothetical protein
VLYRRGVQVTSGNALAARLAKSALDLGIPIHTSTGAKELILAQGRVAGALVDGAPGQRRILARKGVVLACGGFSHDLKRIREAFPHVKRGGEHFSPVPEGNTGDGGRMAEAVGGRVEIRYSSPAAWMPTSKVPLGNGRFGAFPHLLDRYKPGIIGVLKNGQRFTNESNSYHDVGAAMIEACKDYDSTADVAGVRPGDHQQVRPGLCQAGADAAGPVRAQRLPRERRDAGRTGKERRHRCLRLEAAVRRYNEGAVRGEDPEFGRGRTSFKPLPGRSGSEAESVRRADRQRVRTTRSRWSWAISAPSTASRPTWWATCSMRGRADRGPVRGRQRPRQRHGRQLSGRRHHAGADHDLRLHHGSPPGGHSAGHHGPSQPVGEKSHAVPA